MYRSLFLSACLATLLAACGSDPEEEAVAAMGDMADILAGIDDEASAKAARPKLEKLAERMADIQDRMLKQDLSEEESQKRMERLGKEMEKVVQRVQKEMMRIMQDPELAGIMAEEMEKAMGSSLGGG